MLRVKETKKEKKVEKNNPTRSLLTPLDRFLLEVATII
jgi:hypothetical protein